MKRYLLSILIFAFIFPICEQIHSQNSISLDTSQTTPKKVFVSILLLDVKKIDDINKKMTIDFVVRMSWNDASLKGINQQIFLDGINNNWYPNLQFLNNIDLEPKLKESVFVMDGVATYAQRFSGDVSISANFKHFPIDEHVFDIKAVAVGLDSITFINNQKIVAAKTKLSIVEWDVGDYELAIVPFRAQVNYLSGFEFRIQFKRKVQFYIWKTFIPLTLVILMSWTVFWVHPKHLEAQIAITVTSLLTFVTFQFILSNILPPLSYLTKMDIYIFGANMLVFLSLIETVVSSYFYDRENFELADKIDIYSRYIFPVLLIIVFIAAYFW